MRRVAWHAYYGDGATYRSDRVAWRDLPRTNVVVVVVFFDRVTSAGFHYRELLANADWYYLDVDDVLRRVPSGPEWGTWRPKPDVSDELVKRGDFVPRSVYDDLIDRAKRDRTWA